MHTGHIDWPDRAAALPPAEIARCVQLIRAHPEHHLADELVARYRSMGLRVVPDPFDQQVADAVEAALRERAALSVIRIGDIAANFLTFGWYPDTPELDKLSRDEALYILPDTFVIDAPWTLALRDMLHGAIAQADVVGVLGVWRPRARSVDEFIARFLKDCRGVGGQWRGTDYMLHLARQGGCRSATIGSAFLYFGVLERLRTFLPVAQGVLVISSADDIARQIRRLHPDLTVEHIPVGFGNDPDAPRHSPSFLARVEHAMPRDMRGWLCLVGAGPWAVLYCTWAKQRGAVAVDLGSGCDLLAGQVSRQAHRTVGLDKVARYALAGAVADGESPATGTAS